MNAPSQDASIASARNQRNGPLIVVTLVLAVILISYLVWWILNAKNFESTDDAYVAGNVVQVTPQVGGTVVAIHADDTELVQAGTPLIELDRSDAKVALDQADAQLAQTIREVRVLYANNGALSAGVAQRSAEVERAKADLARRQQLIGTGAVSKEELEHARSALQSATSALLVTSEQLASNRALTDRTSVAKHPNVERAAARVREAYLAYARTTLPAPLSGYIAKRSVQLGQRVAAGMPLLSIVPLKAVWVDANFKEVQIAHMRIGQPVTLESDVYGSKIVYHGKVAGLAAGTGSAFALLPAQNASGNWIKIVQRLPVRIALDPKELTEHPLRLGLSMQVKVEVAPQKGVPLPSAGLARTEPAYKTTVFDAVAQQADARIAGIIAANVGSSANSAVH
ncbi:MAG: HlyD family efflux transporter periplasmic adaptor subunit [Glaciimonas sp.]|nr:HlyD family efflux transporter periplasmic adaptor subunit [Glaciimonas sp.]